MKKAIDEKDLATLGVAAAGVAGGAGVFALLGGMGLAVGGTAVATAFPTLANYSQLGYLQRPDLQVVPQETGKCCIW